MRKYLGYKLKSCFLIPVFILSGCTYYFEESRKLAEKYNISKDEAQQCYLKFKEDTEDVLDWVEDNESWFFGFFSEDCEDLIAQLPPFGSAENLLAAKNNNWGVNDNEYKEFLEKRKLEKIIEEIDIAEKKREKYIIKMKSGIFVEKEDFKEKWPFTIESGYLDCVGGAAVLRTEYREYGLNGVATSIGYYPIDNIWRTEPYSFGGKVYIGEMIRLACP